MYRYLNSVWCEKNIKMKFSKYIYNILVNITIDIDISIEKEIEIKMQ